MAANQLLYDMRICVVRMNNGEYETMVNPKLTPTENPVFVVDQEACYSIPGFTARVTRCKEITVEYISEFGEYKKGLLTGPEAQYTQHEVDHLDGVLISDKNPMFGQSKLTKLQRRFKKYNFIYSVDELGHFDFEPEHGAIQNTVNPFAS
jgi:peptide deformylase